MVQKAGIQILNRKQILWTLKKIKDLFVTRSYYRKESAAFLAYELNAKIYTSRQFSVISPMFPSRSSFKPVHKLILN